MSENNQKPKKILRFPEVQKRTCLGRTTIWRLEQTGDFPPRRMLGTRSVGWAEEDIDQWIDTRKKVQQA